MDNSALLISFIVCGIGLTMWFVYLNPFGFVLDGLGFMLFIYGLKKEDSESGSEFFSYYSNKASPELDNAKEVVLSKAEKGVDYAKYHPMIISILQSYRHKGFVNAELLLDSNIKDKMTMGKTKEEAIEELYQEK